MPPSIFQLHSRGVYGAALGAAIAAIGASPAAGAPVTVQVRVEGATDTLVSRSVATDAKTITMASGPNFSGAPFPGGSYTCNGLNHGQPGPAGATPFTALDDAAHGAGASWYGPFNAAVDDFTLYTIAGEGATGLAGPYFDVRVNYTPVSGGCTTRVFDGDEVLFALNGSGQPALKLAGPTTVTTGQAVTYTVTDGATDATVAGADVAGQTSAGDGKASVTFTTPGIVTVRATKAGAIRSRALSVCVNGADGTSCTDPNGTAQGNPSSGTGTIAPTVPPAPSNPERPAPVCPDPTPDGRCDTPRQQPPQARIGSIGEKSVYVLDRSPWVFSGDIGWPSRLDRSVMFPNITGLKAIKLRLTRTSRGRCQYFSGKLKHFRRMNQCGATHGFWFEIPDTGPDWTWQLPRALKAGRYVLDVNAVDGWGRRDNGRRRGENRVVFYVR